MMTRVALFLVAVLIVLGVLVTVYALLERQGVETETVKEPTKEELMPELRGLVMPLRQVLDTPVGSGIVMTPYVREQVVGAVREAQLKYGGTEGGRAALRALADEVGEMAKEARDREKWAVVQACIDVYELLGMTSLMLRRMDQKAELMLAMPKVRVVGIVDDPGKEQTYILMRLIDRETQQFESRYARVGEEVDSLKILDIVGRNAGVRFAYTRIPGLEFEVEVFK
ncbi:MAG TPA: hypothetical protein PKI11_12430 [Candidatus Hydrogenedentes bacterium]|nr:hypothetical protein [Candidatus Hydrogenedentota bacterium]